MGRRARGFVFCQGGRWKVRVTLKAPKGQRGKRSVYELTEGCTELEAIAEAEVIAELARFGKLVTAPKVEAAKHETCETWWERYFAIRKTKGQSTVGDSRGRVHNWVLPSLNGLFMRSVRSEDLRRVVRVLDDAILANAIKPKTARNIWGDVTSAFRESCSSKYDELRVRDDDPALGVQGPESGIKREKPILFPDEFQKLVECERVPVERRRLYAVAVYLAARSSELRALTAANFDMLHQQATVRDQIDRKTKDTTKTKTRRTRTFILEPTVVSLLAGLVAERPKGPLLDMPTIEEEATTLRADLKTAGVLRHELHHETDAHLPMWFHHLRDTGLTWMAVRGDDPLRIQFRGGHTDFKTTQGYIARARNLPGSFGEPFGDLPASILPPIPPRGAKVIPFPSRKEGVPNGIRRRESDTAQPKSTVTSGHHQPAEGRLEEVSAIDSATPEQAELQRAIEWARSVRRCVRHALNGDEASYVDEARRSFKLRDRRVL